MGDADADMTVIAALVDHHGAYLPTLVAELSGSAYVAREPLAAGGDLTNVIVSTLLERDFTLVTNLRRAPRPAAGWVATLAESVGKWSGLEVTIRGDVFYVGTVHLPPGWTEAVERFGWCVVYAGAFRAVDSPGGTLRTLRAAAAAGGLAGGRMPVVWRTT
jgi:hypothetical protein